MEKKRKEKIQRKKSKKTLITSKVYIINQK